MCCLRFEDDLNTFGHCVQECGLKLLCLYLTCSAILDLDVNVFPQASHVRLLPFPFEEAALLLLLFMMANELDGGVAGGVGGSKCGTLLLVSVSGCNVKDSTSVAFEGDLLIKRAEEAGELLSTPVTKTRNLLHTFHINGICATNRRQRGAPSAC